MTDITELAQRDKFEAWWEREYKHLESSKYTDVVPHIKYGFWMAYQAGGAELVEALEKMRQELNVHEVRLIDQRATLKEYRLYTTRLNEERRLLKERIAELEGRSVKLPKRHSMLLREDFKEDYRTLMAYKADEVQATLTAAGIKVEAE